jgi:hypothetical protein
LFVNLKESRNWHRHLLSNWHSPQSGVAHIAQQRAGKVVTRETCGPLLGTGRSSVAGTKT